jgi:hypothetical protein
MSSHSMKCSHLWESAVNRKESMMVGPTVRVFSVYLLIASVAFPLHSPSTRSTNSGYEYPLSILDHYVICFSELRLPQDDLKCIICINVCHNTSQYYMFGVRLSGTVNINTKFSIKQTSTVTTQCK